MRYTLPAVLFCAGFSVWMPVAHAQPARLGLRPLDPQSTIQEVQAVQNGAAVPGGSATRTPFPVYPQPPSMLILPVGTIITIESSELLSSDKQHEGDSFVAELQNPLIVDGWVVARPGQTVIGRVAKSRRAGRVKGTSKLSLELQQIVLVDGRQAPVESELVENSGATSRGRDLAAVGITTGVGAAIGAVCGAKGAAIGAAAGAAASVAGVLLTRGEDVEVGPEKLLTFRLASPISVSTTESQHAFWQVTSDDYLLPEKVTPRLGGNPGPVIVSQPGQRPVGVTVWPEAQGLAVGRPGRSGCGN